MRCGDVITALLRHTMDHDFCCLLLQFQQANGWDAPLLLTQVDSIEGALAGGWRPCAVVWCDRGGGIESWDSALLPGGDEDFMRECVHLICESRAQQHHVPLIRCPEDEADA